MSLILFLQSRFSLRIYRFDLYHEAKRCYVIRAVLHTIDANYVLIVADLQILVLVVILSAESLRLLLS